MRPSDPSVIVDALAGAELTGAVRMSNGMLALVFEDGHLLAISGTAYLLHEAPAADVLVAAEKRLTEEAAELTTLKRFMHAPADEVQPSVREQATRMRDETAVHAPRRKIEAVISDAPPFIGEDHPGLGMSDVENRARLERIERDVPDV